MNSEVPPGTQLRSTSRFGSGDIFILVLGLLALLVSALYLIGTFQAWATKNLLAIPVTFTGFVILFSIGVTFVLLPFSDLRLVSGIVHMFEKVLWALQQVAAYQLVLASVALTLLLFGLAPLVLADSLSIARIIPTVATQGLTYAALLVAFLGVTFFGTTISRYIQRLPAGSKTRPTADRSELPPGALAIAEPPSIRAMIYGLMALAYFVANLEGFGRLTLIRSETWSAYKAVLLEVLLSYVAIDEARAAWAHRRGSLSN